MTSADRIRELRQAERAMIVVRWLAVPFALVQVLFYYLPYPNGLLTAGLALVAALAAGNGLITVAHLRLRSARAIRRLARAAFGFDFALVFGFVGLYTFDVNTAMFVMVYLLPLEGAIRYQRRGALGVMAAATAVYAAREWWGHLEYGHPFLWMSITFRMGMGMLIAAVAGEMANRFRREHQHVQALYHHELAAAETLRAMDDLKNTFLSAVSHELRTPLTSVLGFALTLQDRGQQLSEPDRSMIGYIATESGRLAELLDDLLDLDRLTRGKLAAVPRQVDVAETAHRVAALATDRSSRLIDVQADPLVALVDERQLERIIENLLGNAIKYTPTSARVQVRVDTHPEGVLLTVADDGPGVPVAERELIFQPFRRGAGVSAPSPGTGIGLSLVQRFAALHGGRAWVEESPSGGAAFRVLLPAAMPKVV